MIHVLVWAEDRPLDFAREKMRALYPHGVEGAIAAYLAEQPDLAPVTATMADPQQGLSPEVLAQTDVLVFWSHKHWSELTDEAALRIRQRVLEGMGIIFLHSAHASKPFALLLGTRTQALRWREADERQRYWILAPGHPIVQGLEGEYFEIPQDETYGEYFEIPRPDEQIFITSAQGGEIFRSGNCWTRGRGRIFYFQAGHETYPIYYQPEVRRVLVNAVRWAAPNAPQGTWPQWAREAAAPGWEKP